jgi:DNA-binding response OmpR family regulator
MSGPSVLLIDDHPPTLKRLALLVSQAGYDVRTAASIDQALAVMLDVKPSVILLDVGMPSMSAVVFACKLRAAGMLRRTRLIGMSEKLDLEGSARAAGCHGYLAKPLDLEELLQRVKYATLHTSQSRRTVQ